MTSRLAGVGILIFLSSLLVGLSALPSTGSAPAVYAASGVVTPPAQNQQDTGASWTVEDAVFESRYPDGFRFSAHITSSAGDITRGRVIWSHTPGRQKSALIEIDAATGLLTAEWLPGGSLDVVPPWVGITYYWDVGDAAGNSFQTEPQVVEYADNTRDWLRSESNDVIVFSEGLGAQINDLVIEAMAVQRETYRQAWGDLLPYKPRAILFSTRSAWNEWQVGVANSAVIGLTDSDWGGTAQVLSFFGGYNDLAYGTVLHEVAHLYQAEFTVMTPCSWLIEGNATFFEMSQQTDYLAYVRNLARSNQLPNLLDGTGPGTCGQNPRLGYNVGYSFWAWLVEYYGLDGHRKLIQLLNQGITRNDALAQVTGLSAQIVEQKWRVWLGGSATAPTLVPTPPIIWLASPTPFTFGN